MSWEVIIYNFEGDPPVSMDDLPEDYIPPSLGDSEEVREKLSASLPDIDWSEPSAGLLEGDGWTMEFNIRESEEVERIVLHIRGSGNPIQSICRFCLENEWEALDCATGEFINLANPSPESWKEFQDFHDEVLNSLDEE